VPGEARGTPETCFLPSVPPILTRSEGRVLELIAAGSTTAQIATHLCVSHKAIEYHMHHLLWKFESRNRAGLVARAYTLGYLSGDAWPPVALLSCTEMKTLR
jgi:DNA-binding NarL/FixJ family response regulator